MYNDEFELTFDLADAGPKNEQRRPTLPEPEEAAVAAPPVQVTRMNVGAASGSATEALDGFLASLTEQTPGLTLQKRTDVRFADGAPGVQATVSFEPLPGLRTIQVHATRKWRGTLVHLVATLAERDREAHEAEVLAILASYRDR